MVKSSVMTLIYIGILHATIIEIEGLEHLNTALKNGPSVIKFYRPGCPACKQIEHSFATVAQRNPSIQFLAINTTKPNNKETYRSWGVTRVPTLFFVKDGKNQVVARKQNFVESFNQDIHEYFGNQHNTANSQGE